MRDLPRWLNVLLTVLALAALNFLGRAYGQWGLGVVAGVAVFVVGNLAYRFGLSRLWRGRGSTPTRVGRK